MLPCPETIISEICVCYSRLSPPTAGLLSRAPWAHSGALHFHARAPSGAPPFSLCRAALQGKRPARVPAKRVLHSVPETRICTLEPKELSPEPPICLLELDLELPMFYFATTLTYTNLGRVPTLIVILSSTIKIFYWYISISEIGWDSKQQLLRTGRVSPYIKGRSLFCCNAKYYGKLLWTIGQLAWFYSPFLWIEGGGGI